jgi:hypothetical protein
MKKYITVFVLLVLSSLVIGCELKSSYSMQYGFSSEMTTETKIEPTAEGINLEIPFADFSCDSKSFKAVLDRDQQRNEFILNLAGNETEERCSQKFLAEITGISPGEYWLAVIYQKGEQQQQVLYEKFTITE